jgi:hypothetical protein
VRAAVFALALGLLALGVALVLGALVLISFNSGSCPAIPPGQPACDHTMTFGGVTFWIGATSSATFTVGAVAFASGVGVGLYGVWSKGRRTPQS